MKLTHFDSAKSSLFDNIDWFQFREMETYINIIEIVLGFGCQLVVGPQGEALNLRTLSKIHLLKKRQS